MQKEIKDYINVRYERYLDYSTYKCSCAGLAGEEIDVLNTVLIDVLAKNEDFIKRLYDKKKGQYRELDFFILKLISTYAISNTGPYRHKYRNRLPIDANADYQRIDLIDEPDADTDRAGETSFEMNLVRWIFERLELNDLEYCVFQYRFYEDQSIADLSVLCDRNTLYEAYNIVARSMYEILKSQGLTKAKPKTKNYNVKRVEAIVKAFEKDHLQAFQAEIEKLRYILEQEY